ncbi:MAG TPA: dTMP kinase [Bauldia sp.]|nr:dTMP kinase [Bauldia sp.]
MSGKFITFEGGEGAGKSTQIRRLADRLTATGASVTVTREPGGTPSAEAIRRVLLSGLARPLGAETEAVLFAAARADHVETLIRPALAEGRWVLCDRFADSTRVYQGAGGGVDGKFLDSLDRITIGTTRPDLTFILDIPVEAGLKRIAARTAAGGEGPDRFEGEAIAAHEKRRQAYLDIAALEPERCVLVDAARPEDEVAEAIWNTVRSRFLQRAA